MKRDVIVVDDDPDILDSIKTLFEFKGYHVHTAKNGTECLDILAKGFAGVVLMDIMMPGMDGWETIREIVKQGLAERVHIVVVTAIGTPNHDKMKGLEPYIYDYITKPFNPSELMLTVEQSF